MNILETKDLSHDFNGTRVLHSVGLNVKQGEPSSISFLEPMSHVRVRFFFEERTSRDYLPTPCQEWASGVHFRSQVRFKGLRLFRTFGRQFYRNEASV